MGAWWFLTGDLEDVIGGRLGLVAGYIYMYLLSFCLFKNGGCCTVIESCGEERNNNGGLAWLFSYFCDALRRELFTRGRFCW